MPSPSGPRTGRFGYMNGIPFMSRWNLNWLQQVEERVHSASESGAVNLIGIEDWNGTAEGFSGWPNLFPGDETTVNLFTAPSTGTKGDPGMVYSGNAIIDSLNITLTFQPNASIAYSLGFSANGCLSEAEGSYEDTTSTCEASVCQLAAEYAEVCDIEVGTGTGTGTSGALSYSEIPNVESVTLNITTDNQVIVNSSTDCCTEREKGVTRWNVSIIDQETYPLLDFNKYYAFRFWVGAAEYWEVLYNLLSGVNNINVDRRSGAIINKSNDFAGVARICCDGTNPSTGHIIDPDGTTQWPE